MFSITKKFVEDTPSKTTSQTNLMNYCAMGKLVIFCSEVVVFKHELFYQHYFILDKFSKILEGPASCLLGDILVHLK